MAIVQKDGFNFFNGLLSEYIVVESRRIDEYVDYIHENNILSVAIIDICYKMDNINFLEECSFIEKINIDSFTIENYSGLKHLNNLKELSLEEPKETINVSTFKHLKNFSCGMNKNIVGIEKCTNLMVLRLWKYKPKIKNLEELTELTNLEELLLTQSHITSLKGLGNFSYLKKLELNYNNKLENIDEIIKSSDSLTELFVESCKSIENLSSIGSLKKLEKLTLFNCGDIPSISFIKKLPKLKFFVFMGSNVVDGDISPCLGLEYVAFNDKKHFSHKMKDFK